LWASLFDISDDKFFWSPFDAFIDSFDQISGSRRSMLLFLITEKGPRAAKISWRAALWPCLVYRLELDLKIATAASREDIQFKSGQNERKDNHLASSAQIRDTLSIIETSKF
jgi:hypothetical protein